MSRYFLLFVRDFFSLFCPKEQYRNEFCVDESICIRKDIQNIPLAYKSLPIANFLSPMMEYGTEPVLLLFGLTFQVLKCGFWSWYGPSTLLSMKNLCFRSGLCWLSYGLHRNVFCYEKFRRFAVKNLLEGNRNLSWKWNIKNRKLRLKIIRTIRTWYRKNNKN